MNTFARSLISALAFAGAFALAGCGGGTGDNPNGGKAFNSGSGGGTSSGSSGGTTGTVTVPAPVVPPPPVAGVASLVLTLADPTTGAATNSVPAIARAIVRDDTGVAVPNTVVTFTVQNATLATLVPSAGTALTDSTGTATVRLNAANLSSAGATTLSATSQVNGTGVNGSIGFAIGAANVAIGNFTIGTNPLSAFGTTSVSVTVTSNGTPVTSPQTVDFSSPCSGSGRAVLTSSVLTGAGGVATASYRDNGCGGTDTITASVSGLATASQNLNITVPNAGSIQFVSATPTSITLKGTGGAGRQETSQVIFKVVDTAGNPLSTSQTVNFSLSTAVGGITFANGLTTATATSDPTTGQAFVTVQAGTIATPVRILATTTGAGGVTLSTQSDQLTISTGIPDQSSMSIAATAFNIEGFNRDGETTVLTVRLADHFSNPVPDGTTVNFVAEGGSITSFCNTASGGCTATMTSQELRPPNGRVTVLAYAIGEESFTDLDGDGLADKVNGVSGTSELVDFAFQATDIPEAFLDANEDDVRNANEPFVDFNSNGAYNAADGSYNGVLCNETAAAGTPTIVSSAGTCSAQKSVHIFRNQTIVFSGSDAVIQTNINPATGIVFGACTDPATYIPSTATINVVVTDLNGNAMPAGTTVAFSTTSGSITSTPTTFTVPSTIACLTGVNTYTDNNAVVHDTCPFAAPGLATGALSYSVGMKSGVTVTGTPPTCTPVSPGIFTITVTTPRGRVTTYQATVTN
jgi:hypothetical protein